jgi:hypothetical protein
MLLRVESAILFAGAVWGWGYRGGGVLGFALLLLVPDVTMIAYAVSARAGAAWYNAAHALPAPVALAVAGEASRSYSLTLCALVWIAHIAMDRALGYGLKYGTGFRHTHLGLLPGGVPAPRQPEQTGAS